MILQFGISRFFHVHVDLVASEAAQAGQIMLSSPAGYLIG